MNNKHVSEKGQQKIQQELLLTLKLEAIGLSPIQEPDGIIRVINRPKHVLLLTSRVVGDNTSLQLSELIATTANSDQNRSVFGPKRAMENLLDPTPTILERRFNSDRGSDSKLLDYVTGLEHISGPLIGFRAPF